PCRFRHVRQHVDDGQAGTGACGEVECAHERRMRSRGRIDVDEDVLEDRHIEINATCEPDIRCRISARSGRILPVPAARGVKYLPPGGIFRAWHSGTPGPGVDYD